MIQVVQGWKSGCGYQWGKSLFLEKCQRSKMGRPLFPSLFNLVADVFSTLLCRGSKERVVVDLVPHLVKGD
jgi:hypothetical protein